MVRGRPMNTALPETRGLVQQRKFRAKKAEKIAELESTNRALVEENKQLRTELQLMRDHLLNPNASLPSIVAEKEVDGDGEKIRIQMGVVQGVRDQLENALSALRAIGGDVGLHVPQDSPMSMTSQNPYHTPDLPIASSSQPMFHSDVYGSVNTAPPLNAGSMGNSATSKCCKGATSCSTPSVSLNDNEDGRLNKRRRQVSPAIETFSPFTSGHTSASQRPTPIHRASSSAIRDMSPPIDRKIPPMNSAECCLGIVACDERGEIVGWSS